MLTSMDIERAMAQHFGYRTNLIVPNVSWGWALQHEADVIVLRPSGWATEIEIKVSASDIKADLSKSVDHWGRRINTAGLTMGSALVKQCYFAVPAELSGNADIPEYCGILSVTKSNRGLLDVIVIRVAPQNPRARKVSDKERLKLAALGCMRIWSLKDKLVAEYSRRTHNGNA